MEAIYDIIKGSSGDDFYICDARVKDGDLRESEAQAIQEWAQKQDVDKLFNLVNDITCKEELPSTSIALIDK